MPIATAIPIALGLGLGASAVQGRQQSIAQKRGIRQQEEAQRLATSRAAAEQRRQEMEQRRANRKKPNLSSLLSDERRGALTGPGATMLTGAGGVNRQRLTLGQSSLLGAT